MNAAELFIRSLENENLEYIFGIPGEENIHLMDVLLDSEIKFILTRHEQGAAFMADVYGRLTGKPAVCMSTLGPGASNLITGFADANMDNAPIVAVAGQGATTRMHKESHQILDLVSLFRPISKYSVGITAPEVIPEVVRKAFKVAKTEKPGGCFIDVPENIAAAKIEGQEPLAIRDTAIAVAQPDLIDEVAEVITKSEFPIIMAGNGVIRGKACAQLINFIETLNIPAVNTFMAKGCVPFSHELSIGTVGLQARDYATCGFERADVVICVGYDMVEYHPYLWNPNKDKHIIHIDATPAEVDEHYNLEYRVLGDIASSLKHLTQAVLDKGGTNAEYSSSYRQTLKTMIEEDFSACANDTGCPVKPQKILWDVRQVLDANDILISDVGAHKMWIARIYQAEAPNTCIISNGFASMGIGVPGAIAAKMIYPQRAVMTITGDAGFMMNSQELETAMRHNIPIVVMIWRDDEYGLIRWHQQKAFGRASHISFNNPDFVKYAESFGAKGFRVEDAKDLQAVIKEALSCGTVAVIDCPVDYSVNMQFTEKMGKLVCPI
ncbi:MAG: acetolactate synthase large subunit [Chromatiales bacterium]|nr:acetolactate synthase large subunit [Chromatiales bacterium]